MKQNTIYLIIALAVLSIIFLSQNTCANTPTDEQTEHSESSDSIDIFFEKYNSIELTGITTIEHPEGYDISLDKDASGANILSTKHITYEKMIILWESKKDNPANHLNFKINQDKDDSENTKEINGIKIKNILLEKSDKIASRRRTLNYHETQQILDILKKHKHTQDPDSIQESLQKIKSVRGYTGTYKHSTYPIEQKPETIAQQHLLLTETITTKQYTSETIFHSANTQSYATTSTQCPKPDFDDDCYISDVDLSQYIDLYFQIGFPPECLSEAIDLWGSNGNPDTTGNGCIDDNELINYITIWEDGMFGDNCLIHVILIWMGECDICGVTGGYVDYGGDNSIDIAPKKIFFFVQDEYDPSTPHDKKIIHYFKWEPLDLYMLKGRSNVYPLSYWYLRESVLNIKSNKDVYDYCQPEGSIERTYDFLSNLPEPNDLGSEESDPDNPCHSYFGKDEEIEIASPVDKIFPLGPDPLYEGDGIYYVEINIKSRSSENAEIVSIEELGNHKYLAGMPCIGEKITDTQYP